MVLLDSATLACGLAFAVSSATASSPPCSPRVTTLARHHAIVYCGPATVTIQLGERTYHFRSGLCDRSSTMGALVLNVGTLVEGASGNAGRSFVSLVIAQSPSESEAFEADAEGRQLFGDSVVGLGGNLLGRGTFTSLLGPAFSGSWNCHGVVYAGA